MPLKRVKMQCPHCAEVFTVSSVIAPLMTYKELRIEAIFDAINRAEGNMALARKICGIPRTTFFKYVKAHRLQERYMNAKINSEQR